MTVDGREAIVELKGTYLLRVTEVLTRKVARSHACDRDIPFILNTTTAGN
ncbi:hypothetical protein GCM10009443_19840 [Mucilaginibacter ginsenosidivorans]